MLKGMSSTERVLAALRRQTPDRVPHFEWSHDARLVDALTRGGTYEDLIDLLDIDAVMCQPDYPRNVLADGCSSDEWGVIKALGSEGYMPLDERAPIQSWADFETWNPPDPVAPYRYDTMKERIARFKGRRAIIVYVRDVWSYARDLMGYINLCVACLEQPALVSAIVERCLDHTIQVAGIAAEMGAEVVFTGDDIADNRSTLMSPTVWNQLFMPHFRRLVHALHDVGLLHWKHSDGNIMPVLDSLVAAGIDGIDPIDPLGGMDLALIKKKYGSRVAIKGNIDCVQLLTSGAQESVVEAVKACLRVAGPGGGYACSSSNSIHSGIRPDLYVTMVQAIHQYGTYPLDMDRLHEV